MSTVSVEQLSKRFQHTVALDSVSIDFQDGEFFALLGPSGSGKTTLLRCIAGFVLPDRGSIRFNGQPVQTVPVHKRDIGMVFQHYALFPHMSVFDNVAFGLSVRGMDHQAQRAQVSALLKLVQLEGFERRKPRELSGGQQQRVALARALITRPQVLLLDEPLGALDKRLRQEMQIELKQIQRRLGLTTIFVTHDQEEALTLSDRIAIIDQGRVVQIGAPHEVYERPRSVFAASFLGDANFFSATAVGPQEVRLDDGTLLSTAERLPAGAVTLAVRPEKILLLPVAAAIPAELPNRLRGRIAQLIYAGSSTTYLVEFAGGTLKAFARNRTQPLAPATPVTAAWAAEHTVVVEP
jgi:spermidine/putrescine ABC transporter ATP-binding subunit